MPPGSQAARRERTRARLLDAAKSLFAEQGVDGTRLQDIVRRADVAFGSLYNHFQDKEAIVDAVLRDATERQGAAVDALTADIDDPAEVVAIAHRHFLRLAQADPTWGWLLIRLDLSHRALDSTLGPRALRDVQRGMETGRFAATDPLLALNATGGALLGTARAVLEGRRLGAAVDERHAELVLRMLGVPARAAAEISQRPLPPVVDDPARPGETEPAAAVSLGS